MKNKKTEDIILNGAYFIVSVHQRMIYNLKWILSYINCEVYWGILACVSIVNAWL